MQHLIHSSPPSSEMELSRNLQQPTQNGESRVQDIVTKYRKVKALNPIVSRICESTKNQDTLRKSLQHDLSIIRGRSSRLDDHEISITQKAYMLLMQNRDDRLGGIELYVQEIIGLQYVDATESLASLQTAMKTRDVLLHRMNPSPKNRRFVFYLRGKKKNPMSWLNDFFFLLSFQADSSPAADHHTHEGQSRRPSSVDSDFTACSHPISGRTTTTTDKNVHGELILSPVSDAFAPETPDQNTGTLAQHHPSSDGTINDPTDPKFQRLWSLFLEARADFDLQSTDNFRRTTAAKFLRDTIENCLSYISTSKSSSSPDHHPDEASRRQTLLEDTLALAIEAAERGSGGRKRRFDLVAGKKTSNKRVVGGKFVTRRAGRNSGSRAAAHGNGGKQAMRHASRHKAHHLWGISNSFDKLTPQPHTKGTRVDD